VWSRLSTAPVVDVVRAAGLTLAMVILFFVIVATTSPPGTPS
jgi:hypothetical protein